MGEFELEDRRDDAGDAFTNVRVRHPVRTEPSWSRVLKGVAHAVGAAILLIAGTVWTIRMQHPKYVSPGDMLLPPALIIASGPSILADTMAPPPTDQSTREQVFKVSHFLRAYTRDTLHAERIAGAIVRQANQRHISPALLIGVLLTEDAKLDPLARSSVGARGLMQVMPFHAGKYGCGSNDLFNVEANICYGATILQQMMRRSPSVSHALQRYNGCVRGTNTPNCHTYSGKVLRYAEQAATKMLTFSFGN